VTLSGILVSKQDHVPSFFYIDFQSTVLIIVAVEKQIIITYSESALLDFGTQNEMPMRHIVICVLPDITIFCHIIS